MILLVLVVLRSRCWLRLIKVGCMDGMGRERVSGGAVMWEVLLMMFNRELEEGEEGEEGGVRWRWRGKMEGKE